MSISQAAPAPIDGHDLKRVLSDDVLANIYGLCGHYGVATLDLFGSAATGEFDEERSDIDLVVDFVTFTEPAGRANAFFGLHEELEALLQRRVDLLTDASIKNPFLRRSIERSRRRLFPHAAV